MRLAFVNGAIVASVAAILLTVSGCAPTVAYGVKPQTDRLSQFVPGQTKAADILLSLGEPRGKGAAHPSPGLPPREIWFYEYVRSDGKTANLDLLLVFMNGDSYDGHLWFSSVDTFKKSYNK